MIGLVICQGETAANVCPCYTYWRWPITKSFGNYPRRGVGRARRKDPARWFGLIGRPILVSEAAGPITEGLEVHVDVRIADFVIRSAVADDQKHGIGR